MPRGGQAALPLHHAEWVAAHGVILLTPTHWYQAPTPLKAMIDRLACADGGNPDPNSTHGKKPEEAKALELKGWDFPEHLDGRAYDVLVHGDVAGIESVRRNLSGWLDWLDWGGLIDAGTQARLDRYIGYYEPYATSHETLDKDAPMQEETRNVARAVAHAVVDLRAVSRLSTIQPHDQNKSHVAAQRTRPAPTFLPLKALRKPVPTNRSPKRN